MEETKVMNRLKLMAKFIKWCGNNSLSVEPYLVWGWIETEILDKKEKTRSNPQNRYYRGVVVPLLSQETGYTTDEIHEILKYKFLYRQATLGEKELGYAVSTTELSTAEFEDYLSRIRTWASADLSIFIPEPNEYEVQT